MTSLRHRLQCFPSTCLSFMFHLLFFFVLLHVRRRPANDGRAIFRIQDHSCCLLLGPFLLLATASYFERGTDRMRVGSCTLDDPSTLCVDFLSERRNSSLLLLLLLLLHPLPIVVDAASGHPSNGHGSLARLLLHLPPTGSI